MNTIPYLHFNGSTKQFQTLLQISMDLSPEIVVQADEKVLLVQNIMERIGGKYLSHCVKTNGRPKSVSPITMLSIFVFCYSEGIYSYRDIAKACIYDLRLRFLLQGQSPPGYSTLCRFHQRIAPFLPEMLEEFVHRLCDIGHIDLSSIYIDGTKMESVANRYSFVWKKTIRKNQGKLLEKIQARFGLSEPPAPNEGTRLVRQAFANVQRECKRRKIVFVSGRGHRKTPEQREYETYKEWLERLETYEEYLIVMGERNSTSKTDPDATFMRMKEDHMKNGQLKPAYNIQFATTGQYIIGVHGSHHPSDMWTLPPFLDDLRQRYGQQLRRIVTDSGYESVENYAYLKEHGLVAFIKPQNHQQKKKRAYRKDIGRRENMIYHPDLDAYECAQGKLLHRQNDQFRTRKHSGYQETIRVYRCEECENCPRSSECVKSRKYKNPKSKSLTFSPEFEAYRKESEANINSPEGKEERINRSIQAEGAFSKCKEGLGYRRFRHRGLSNILTEMLLMSLAINLNQYYHKLQREDHQISRYRYLQ